MLSETLNFALAAGAVNDNAFANSRYATLSKPAMIRYWAIQDGATAPTDALIEITHGNVIVRSNSAIVESDIVGGGPKLNENMIAEAGADINDRIVIRAQNTGVATINFRIIVGITLLPMQMQQQFAPNL